MESKTIQCEFKVLYKVEVGHDGYTAQCGYDGSDYWHEVYYGDTIKELALKLAKSEDYNIRLDNVFELSKIEAIIYNGRTLHYSTLDSYKDYSKKDAMLSEYNELMEYLSKDEEIAQLRKEITDKYNEKLKSRKAAEKRLEAYKNKKAELATLEALKNKYCI